MRKFLFLFIILSTLLKTAGAQDFTFGEIGQNEMDMGVYDRDTSAGALVLNEFGRAHMRADEGTIAKLVFEYHVKIKIFDTRGFEYGNVETPAFNSHMVESLNDISGVTFFKDDNGQVQKIELDRKNIYLVKMNDEWSKYKFALPGLKKGCVIEFKYTVETPYFDDFHPWYFQSNIPKKYSEYEVHIPAYWSYNASLKGVLKLSKQTSDIENGCFSSRGATCDCSLMVYGMQDIPKFVKEDYMTSPRNFLSAVNFELVKYVDLYNGSKKEVSKTWDDVDRLLKSDSYFGVQLKHKGKFKEHFISILSGKTNDQDKAKAIYLNLQRWFKWNNNYGVQSFDIVKAFENHTGNVADINLSLVTALNAASIDATPVLLSTREHGALNPLYPDLNDFDYVVAKVNIENQSFLLDATDPLLPFGTLPFRCLNDKGRVIETNKPSYWIDLNLPQKQKNLYSLELTLQNNGSINGTLTHFSIGYESFTKRKEIKGFNSTEEYTENLFAAIPQIKILKSEITNLDSLDLPLCEKYEIEIKPRNATGEVSFNPFFLNRIKENPFKMDERFYPIDRGMPYEENYILTMHFPDQYKVVQSPTIISLGLPGKTAVLLSNFEVGNNLFTFSHVIKFNTSIYNPQEYSPLKELYNEIIKSEALNIELKKQ